MISVEATSTNFNSLWFNPTDAYQTHALEASMYLEQVHIGL